MIADNYEVTKTKAQKTQTYIVNIKKKKKDQNRVYDTHTVTNNSFLKCDCSREKVDGISCVHIISVVQKMYHNLSVEDSSRLIFIDLFYEKNSKKRNLKTQLL